MIVNLLMADPSILDYASRGGIIGLLIIIIYGGFKKEPWWVFGWVYRELLTRFHRSERQVEVWQETAIKGTSAMEALSKLKAAEEAEK